MEIGDTRFFDYAVENEKFSKKDLDKLKKLISEKSVPDLKIFLENLDINEELKYFLLKLPKLWGDKKILDVAKNLCMNEKMEEVVSYLSEIFEILEELGYGEDVWLDDVFAAVAVADLIFVILDFFDKAQPLKLRYDLIARSKSLQALKFTTLLV